MDRYNYIVYSGKVSKRGIKQFTSKHGSIAQGSAFSFGYGKGSQSTVNFVAYGPVADQVLALNPFDPIAFIGRFNSRSYVNKEGQTKYVNDIVIISLHFDTESIAAAVGNEAIRMVQEEETRTSDSSGSTDNPMDVFDKPQTGLPDDDVPF